MNVIHVTDFAARDGRTAAKVRDTLTNLLTRLDCVMVDPSSYCGQTKKSAVEAQKLVRPILPPQFSVAPPDDCA